MAVTQVIDRPYLTSPTSELHLVTQTTHGHMCAFFIVVWVKESPLQGMLHQLALEHELTDVRWLRLWAMRMTEGSLM